LNPIKKSKSAPSIKQIQHRDNSGLNKVTKEIKFYTEDEKFIGKGDDVRELYETFRDAIIQLNNDIEVKPQKWYVAFKLRKNIVDVEIQKQSLKIWINLKKGQLDDPKQLTRDVSNLGHGGNGDYELIVRDTKNLEYIMSLVKQAAQV